MTDDFRRLVKGLGTIDDFTGLKKRANVYLTSQTWRAKGDKRSRRQQWVCMFQTQYHPVMYPFLHTHLTPATSPYPKAPLASFLLPSIQIIITVMTPYAALSVITELLWSFRSFPLKVRFDQSHVLFCPKTPQLSENRTPSLNGGQPSYTWSMPDFSAWSQTLCSFFSTLCYSSLYKALVS